MHASLPGNPSAKAAAEAALFDLRAKQLQIPLHRLLSGGYDLHGNGITISAGSGDIMAADCLQYLSEGDYTHHLKIKMGKQPSADADTLITIWHTIREQKPAVTFDFRVDANGGWLPKTAVNIIRTWEREGLPVVWVEQPTPRWDIDGLQSVTQRTDTPIMADESVFTAKDAICVLEKKAADWINIKLAKAGGITRVQEIAALCNAYGVPWMMGCMLESRLAVSAAAACASAWGAGAIDLDGPLLCAKDPFTGGPIFEGPNILFQKTPITPLDSYFGVKP
jgi:L-alanine-DL-glutamate epimerase-like enolase superfamily enzyme